MVFNINIMDKKSFYIKGMHCASCALIIEKKLSKLDGVKHTRVNFATEKAEIDFDIKKVSIDVMNSEIETLGYKIISPEENNFIGGMNSMDHGVHMNMTMKADEKEKEFLMQRNKAEFSMPIALFTFFLMMWDIGARTLSFVPNFPIPMELFNIISMVIATIMMFWIGAPFIEGVTRFVRYRVANMDTLIGIGTLGAYIYSVVITLIPNIREFIRVPDYTYFDVVIVVIGFVVFGKYLETRSKQKTGEAIEKLLHLQAKTAMVVRDGKEIEVSVADVMVGDIIVVKPGGKIPVDGKIIEGNTSIDESMVSGESIPVDKVVGDDVIGATINKQGYIKFTATKIGSDTMLAQIIRMVEEAQGSRAPIQALADKISGMFVPAVLGIAFLSLILWLVIGIPSIGQSMAISYGILSFVGVLVIACPCALGLATPTAIIVGVGKGAEYGILVKDAEHLELLNKVNMIVLDKTGTITKGNPEVTDVVVLDSAFDENEILKFAGSVEKMSEHPLANAIVESATSKNISLFEVKNFVALEGIGVRALVDGRDIYIHKSGVNEKIPDIKKFQEQGKTTVIIELENKKIGLIALSDTLKNGAKEAITALKKRHVKVVMLTGDNHAAAEYIAGLAGIDSVIAEVLPNEKAAKIKELKNQGNIVAMAGDGINDAPALAEAHVGIAMATGTDVAIESAGITILHGDIRKISQAITLSHLTMRTVRQNLFWAFIYNVVGIPIAAGLLYPVWGIVLNPIFAGLAMAFSSVSVVGNSLRLKTKKI